MSEFNKQVGKVIDKDKEDKLKQNWKKTKLKTESSFIGSDIIYELLNTPNAVGLRMYYGMDDEGNMQPIFYASDANGRPIVSSAQNLNSTSTDGGVDTSMPCPPYCP